MTLKIAFIGCVKSSETFLNILIKMPEVEVCAVITKKTSKVNSDFVDLKYICEEHSIPCQYETINDREKSSIFLKKYSLDLIYCFGWSYLLDETVLSIPKIGVIGFHPALLPRNRGRHPIIWALALGLEETGSTFFKMDAFADSGPIISQEKIDILADDKAVDLYEKIMNKASKQIKIFTLDFLNQEANFLYQDNSEATYWRKRNQADGLIDWRMSAQEIYNLVRSLSPPYPCAEFKLGSTYIKVPECYIATEKYPNDIEPGFILKKDTDSLLIKVAGQDAVLIKKLKLKDKIDGDYL